MSYEKKDFSDLLGMGGLSDEILNDHFALYGGYVKNTNKLTDQLSKLDDKNIEYAELKRRFGWEWNGMRLHELYFENLSKESVGLDKNSDLAKKITDSFGSYEKWKEDFMSTGMMRGIGWVVLYEDDGRLINAWINEHNAGHLAGATPLLVMDVFEHAFMKDYGLDKHNRPIAEQLYQIAGTVIVTIFHDDGSSEEVALEKGDQLVVEADQYHIHANMSSDKSVTMWKYDGDISKIIDGMRKKYGIIN